MRMLLHCIGVLNLNFHSFSHAADQFAEALKWPWCEFPPASL
jgi:hypothetical protein